jgi:hypothetical protein
LSPLVLRNNALSFSLPADTSVTAQLKMIHMLDKRIIKGRPLEVDFDCLYQLNGQVEFLVPKCPKAMFVGTKMCEFG